ncbi:MAG TPA: hypothetical protein VFC00_21695, partial [Micromonosporaceae bacterium]|nr:hypothetical protein [Micromonosporaceae bacterium]
MSSSGICGLLSNGRFSVPLGVGRDLHSGLRALDRRLDFGLGLVVGLEFEVGLGFRDNLDLGFRDNLGLGLDDRL